jgi:hypothetical protein
MCRGRARLRPRGCRRSRHAGPRRPRPGTGTCIVVGLAVVPRSLHLAATLRAADPSQQDVGVAPSATPSPTGSWDAARDQARPAPGTRQRCGPRSARSARCRRLDHLSDVPPSARPGHGGGSVVSDGGRACPGVAPLECHQHERAGGVGRRHAGGGARGRPAQTLAVPSRTRKQSGPTVASSNSRAVPWGPVVTDSWRSGRRGTG